MKVLVEKNTEAPGLSRASCIALGLMLSYGAASRRPRRTIATFADLAQIPAEEQDVVLTDEQRSLLFRARYWLHVVASKPQTTLAVCSQCGAAYVRSPGASVPSRCTYNPFCDGKVVWAGKATVKEVSPSPDPGEGAGVAADAVG